MLQTPDKSTKMLLKLADYMEKVDPARYHQQTYNDCCGNGCIAYWATRMLGVHVHFGYVADLIGISKDQADQLFHPAAGEKMVMGLAFCPPSPKDAAKAIRHLAVTGEVPSSWIANVPRDRAQTPMAWAGNV